MPRKAKITAVPIDVQPDQTLEQVDAQEPKTEAEKMTDVINEVNVIESTLSNEDESSIQKAPKARAKRVSKKEPDFIEPEVEVTSSLDEVQAEVVMPKQEPYVEPKVACPDCGKKMSAKTLKYSHGPNCVIHKQKQSREDEEYTKMSHTAKQLAQEVGGESGASALHAIGMIDSLNNFSNHDIKQHIQSRARAERATRREAMVANLVKNAF
jgi:hypothetical protein